jgi:hypothetical protein
LACNRLRRLADAFAQGQLRSSELKQIQIAGRALVYGFARMNIDGHFLRRGVTDAEVECMAEAVFDIFIGGYHRMAGRNGNGRRLEMPGSSGAARGIRPCVT